MNRKRITLLLICIATIGIAIALSKVDTIRYKYIPVQVENLQFLYKIDRITGERALLLPFNDLPKVNEKVNTGSIIKDPPEDESIQVTLTPFEEIPPRPLYEFEDDNNDVPDDNER